MPLHPLFAERWQFMKDDGSDPQERWAKFNAPISEYVSPPVTTEDFTIEGREVDIPVRLYIPENAQPGAAGLVWFHGGGFRMGGLWQNESDVVAREVAHRGGVVVLAVDYRLTINGVAFPAPFVDGTDALRWFVSQLGRLGVDPKRVFVGGISAGGHLASAVAMHDRDSGDNFLAGQLLNCPVVHKVLPEFSAHLKACIEEVGGEQFMLHHEMVNQMHIDNAGGSVEGKPEWWWPGDAASQANLAPAQISNCEYDTLRASGERYAEQLKAAGVPVEVWFEPGTPHAHINRYPQDCPPMDHTIDEFVRFILATRKG